MRNNHLSLLFLTAASVGSFVACSKGEGPEGSTNHEEQDNLGGEPEHDTPDTGGSSSGTGGAGGAGGAAGGPSDVADGCVSIQADCQLVQCEVPLETGTHVAACSDVAYNSNPPTSGPHYGSWAAFGKYDEPVPRGYWMHSLEHSGVVLTYNCGAAQAAGVDCSELVSVLSAFFDAWPEDPLCSATRHRLLLTPDPELDVAFAASAWGHYLKGNCFDEEALTEFIETHYGQNYENLCIAGIDPMAPDYACD